jgi:hypothetical protein
VPVSGDGTTYGDECFIWTDLPMNKMGKYGLVHFNRKPGLTLRLPVRAVRAIAGDIARAALPILPDHCWRAARAARGAELGGPERVPARIT